MGGNYAYFNNFCPNGNYDFYDFRSLGEQHQNTQLQAGLSGKSNYLNQEHTWTFGFTSNLRQVYKGTSIYGADSSTLTSNGQDNLYSPLGESAGSATSSYGAGTVYKILDQTQNSFYINDKLNLSAVTNLYFGSRFIRMNQTSYNVSDGSQYAQLNKWWTIPQIGYSFKITPKLSSYISYSYGLEPGTIPLADSFTNKEIMPPRLTKQLEIGTKYSLGPDSLWTVAVFEMKRPNEFALPSDTDPGYYTLYQNGTVTNKGIESSLTKKLTNRLNFMGSLMYLRATQSDVSIDPSQNGAQAIGIPNWRASTHLDYLIPDYEKLSIQGSWTYSSSKSVDLQDTLRAPGYHRFDAGAKYIEKVGNTQTTFRLYVENIFNTFYWRDVSQSFGANFLYPGAPRIFRATATFDF
jgi:iron complex outermembrane receptor protein